MPSNVVGAAVALFCLASSKVNAAAHSNPAIFTNWQENHNQIEVGTTTTDRCVAQTLSMLNMI